ncbi:hypothetical protein [Marinobacter sp.]|uniref:hypothetical protein n=1 Tax=Marinobacter sp. TaxID=50741 RepID=UPI00397724E1
MRQGEFQPLLAWLRQKIHRHGGCFHPVELIKNACGSRSRFAGATYRGRDVRSHKKQPIAQG